MKQELPDVYVTLRPLCNTTGSPVLQTNITIPDATYAAGDLFDTMPVTLASCACASYTVEDLQVSDASGSLSLIRENSMGAFGPQYSYTFSRDISGELSINYSCPIPAFDGTARNPGFSLCAHDYGLTGAGVTFLLLPQGQCRFHIHMDLDSMDAPALGIAGCNRGDFVQECTSYDLKFIYYALGNLREYHRPGSKLHVFTFDADDRCFSTFADTIGAYFDYMERFFHDENRPYHIFLYPTRRTLLTGTAQIRCCYLGFGADFIIQDLQETEDVLAHELTHNWCNIAENPKKDDGFSSLYAEATAEYYSSAMLYRTGRNDLDTYVASINAKLRDYYANPFREGSYPSVYEKSWTHAFAQRVPYNRGIIWLMQIDQAIREYTDGQQTLDDIVLALADRSRKGHPATWEEMLSLMDAASGNRASTVTDMVLSDGLLLPPSDFFGSAYRLEECTISQNCEGFAPTVRFESGKRIHDLVKDSNAARAGLQNGDQILHFITDRAPEGIQPVTHCTVLRDGKELTFTYAAVGKEVSCWQYRKVMP